MTTRSEPSTFRDLTSGQLFDERSTPDFRTMYGNLLRDTVRLDVAIRSIRLGGITLQPKEIEGPRRIRVLLSDISVLTISAEAEAMAVTEPGRARLELLVRRLDDGSLGIRSSPLAGWSPDFSLFHDEAGDVKLLMGLHWFVRPYPHRGPALASLHLGEPSARIAERYSRLWEGAYDVAAPLQRILFRALMAARPRALDPARP